MNAKPRTACLLVHGFTGSPFEMEPFVQPLEALGCTVDLPTLPGHDRSIAEFRTTFFPDWLACAEKRLLALMETYDTVIPIGFSMGGSIALTLAARYAQAPQLRAAVCLAPAYRIYHLFPLTLQRVRLLLIPALQYIFPEIPLPEPSEHSRALAPFRGYSTPLCLPQLHSLALGLRLMRALLPVVRCPLLLVHDVQDSICHVDYSLNIAKEVSSTDVHMRYLRMNEQITSHHLITTHRDTSAVVCAETEQFVARFITGATTLFQK